MYLRRLTLTNVGPFAHLDLPFTTDAGAPRRVTLLHGLNGTGKTTLLRALGLALAGREALAVYLGDPARWIRAGQEQARIDVELVLGAQPRMLTLVLRRADTAADIIHNAGPALAELDAALAADDGALALFGYGAVRHTAAVPFARDRASAIATLLDPAAALPRLDLAAAELHRRFRAAGLEPLRTLLDALLPGATIDRFDPTTKRLLFRTAGGPATLDDLGAGQRDLALWAGDLMARAVARPDTLPRGLLLLDSPDAFLHPAWQRLLLPALEGALPGVQLVLAAYAPFTVHPADAGELWVLRRSMPGAPPELTQFPGTPRRLLLHQLVLSPLFGVSTLDSAPVERLRDEYRALRDRPQTLGQSETEQRERLREQLEDMPDWRATTPLERQQAALLDEIQQAVRALNQPPDD
jgi:hypothetical protein